MKFCVRRKIMTSVINVKQNIHNFIEYKRNNRDPFNCTSLFACVSVSKAFRHMKCQTKCKKKEVENRKSLQSENIHTYFLIGNNIFNISSQVFFFFLFFLHLLLFLHRFSFFAQFNFSFNLKIDDRKHWGDSFIEIKIIKGFGFCFVATRKNRE